MLRRITDYGVIVGGGLMIFSSALVTIDVFMRKIFGVALPGADEMSSYCFASATAWAFSQVLFERANIRVDIVIIAIPKFLAALMDFLALLSLAAFSIFLLMQTGGVVLETYAQNGRSNTPLQTPLIIPQLIWFSGIAFLNVNVLWLTLVGLLKCCKRDWDGVIGMIGTPEMEQQLQSATESSTNTGQSEKLP